MTAGTQRRRGLTFAAGTAVISGVAVFVNSYGVRAVGDATVYTTAKNLVAAVLLVLVALGSRTGTPRPVARRQLPGLLAVAVIGGSVPFVLFFTGLAHASSADAAFVHKTLVVWVALLAVPLLGERLRFPHCAAIGLLLTGQAILGGGLAGFAIGPGEVLIGLATLLWAVEVIVVKRLVAGIGADRLAAARMGLGVLLLVGWVVVSGRWSVLAGIGTTGWAWAALTGGLLAAYVATWYRALALAPAVDVTAMLVPAAVITAILDASVRGAATGVPELVGGGMLVAGAVTVALARPRQVAVAVR